jgi:putative photosynthetic complex assembly protein 2
MAAYLLPVFATLALWWASTGVILYLDGLPRRTFPWTMAGASAMLAVALAFLVATRGQTTPAAALEAFMSGLAIWAWQLVSFYTGFLTGPRKTACAEGCVGWRRFIEAVRTSLYHECAALLGAALVFALTIGQPNQTGLWTYLLLWWMHQSAKLNVFFGVPNLGEEMLPAHLRFLVSFMRRRPMNLFFPISVSISTVVLVLLVQSAFSPVATPFTTAVCAMLATLMALAILEHWFLVAPIDGNVLWSWAGKRGGKNGNHLVAQTVESWTPATPAILDAERLHDAQEAIETGARGEVERIRGPVKTNASWVRFQLAGQTASMAPFPPGRRQDPRVVAIGQRLDRAVAGGVRRLRDVASTLGNKKL